MNTTVLKFEVKMFEDMNDSIDFDQDLGSAQYTNVMGNESSANRVLFNVPRGTDLSAAHTLALMQGSAGDCTANIATRQFTNEQPGSTHWIQ